MKILFVINNLNTGGVSTSLINSIKTLSKNSHRITLLTFSNHNYSNLLDDNIKIINAGILFRIFGLSQNESKKQGLIIYLFRSISALLSKIIGSRIIIFICSILSRKLSGFDAAVSAIQSGPKNSLYAGANEFVLKNVKSNKKIAFVHTDVIKYKINDNYNYKIYSKFDKIITVSNGSKNSFLTAFPSLSNRVYVLKNLIDYSSIISKSNTNSVLYDENAIILITVARLGVEKGHIRLINVLKSIKIAGIKFKWFIVGDGLEKNNLEKVIFENNLNNEVILVGNDTNPYRWMKHADIFVLVSYHEAAPLVIEEAKILGLSIFTTNTSSSFEMLKGYNSYCICENDDELLSDEFYKYLSNYKKSKKYKSGIFNEYIEREKSYIDFFKEI